jgi:protocatechuate 3,4-dioxygenase beta subunit
VLKRRQLLAAGGAIVAAAVGARTSYAQQTLLPSACNIPLDPILGWNNIPEYKSESPARTSLFEPGTDFWGKSWPGSPREGERLILAGRVLTTRCQPIANARLEFWHTDPKGQYDFAGYNFRGLQNADKDGRYRLETSMPGYYSPRRHLHYLIGVRLDDKESGILVTNIIDLPSEDEFKTGKTGATIPPSRFTRENGVLIAEYDFVINMA